jgi:hypothetical protein
MLSNQERAERIAAATMESYAKLRDLDLITMNELERLFRTALAEAYERLASYSVNGWFSDQFLAAWIADVERMVQQLGSARNSLLDSVLNSAAGLGVTPALAAGVMVDDSIARSVKALWQLELADGLQLSDRLWRIDNKAKEALGSAIRQALASGANPLQAARQYLEQGKGIPPEILAKLQGLQTGSLQAAIQDVLMAGRGNALSHVQRVFQTEMTRAHALAYVDSNQDISGLKGYKFKLASSHKAMDVCDDLAAANRYGLGAGVYPANAILSIYPAHPRTHSYIVAVFD